MTNKIEFELKNTFRIDKILLKWIVKLLILIMKRSMRRKVTWKAKKGNPEKISVKDIESPTDIVNVPKAILMLFNDHVEESIIGNSRVKCCYYEKMMKLMLMLKMMKLMLICMNDM